MSDITDAYDPTAPEGDIAGRGQYMTAKQLRGILLIFFAVLLAMVPMYQVFKGKTDRATCTKNMKAIYDAMSLYAEQHDGRFPTIDRAEEIGSFAPSLGDTGHVYTWASDIAPYMNARASFRCPAAKSDEVVWTEDPRSSTNFLPLTYGMYAAYSGFMTSLVENPAQTIIIAETSDRGAEGTFDPQPFGPSLPDGFVIGWSDSNVEADKKTTAVTRLAFSQTSDGRFKADGPARHGDAIHLLTANGERINANPEYSLFHYPGSTQINPSWAMPPITPLGGG
jgi:hypothetical protein